MGRSGVVLALVLACSSPTRDGQTVDPQTFHRAERACRERAIARYGPPPASEAASQGDRSCDPQSWLCRRAENWMMDPDNSLSTATPWQRTVHRSVRACMERQGYAVP